MLEAWLWSRFEVCGSSAVVGTGASFGGDKLSPTRPGVGCQMRSTGHTTTMARDGKMWLSMCLRNKWDAF